MSSSIPDIRTLARRATRRPVYGRALPATGRRRSARDPRGRRSSDEVWSLVERMMAGDSNAAIVLNDLIEEGVEGGSTVFEKITRRGYKRFGKEHAAVVQPGAFAAITPGRSIVLFGVKKEYKRSDPPGGVLRGYMRRFAIGDTAEYDSYNLVYLGKITAITPKRVTVDKGHGRQAKAVMDVETFNSKNYDLDVEAAIKRNQEWSD